MIPHCGECPLFKYECTDGWGWCDVRERKAYCGDQCEVDYKKMIPHHAVKNSTTRRSGAEGRGLSPSLPTCSGKQSIKRSTF